MLCYCHLRIVKEWYLHLFSQSSTQRSWDISASERSLNALWDKVFVSSGLGVRVLGSKVLDYWETSFFK